MRRSNFSIIVTVMYNYGMLRDDDLKQFSESVQKFVSTLHAED